MSGKVAGGSARKPVRPASPSKAKPRKPRAPRSGSGRSGSGKSGSGKQTSAPPRLLVRPAMGGPSVRLGVLWFLVAVGSLTAGRWAVLAVWGGAAAVAAWQVTRAWATTPGAADLPSWGPIAAAVTAVICTSGAAVGTSLGGVALIVAPIVLVAVVALSGPKPAAAGAAVIGAVLAAVPAMSVVLVARNEQWAALFLVVAVSFYDAGYFIGAAESSSRLEGPVTGAIGLLAVAFAASAFEAQPFDRVTSWIAGALLLFACPLGQMLVSAELPSPDSRVPAMRRLDSYLVAAPVMLAAAWVLG